MKISPKVLNISTLSHFRFVPQNDTQNFHWRRSQILDNFEEIPVTVNANLHRPRKNGRGGWEEVVFYEDGGIFKDVSLFPKDMDLFLFSLSDRLEGGLPSDQGHSPSSLSLNILASQKFFVLKYRNLSDSFQVSDFLSFFVQK